VVGLPGAGEKVTLRLVVRRQGRAEGASYMAFLGSESWSGSHSRDYCHYRKKWQVLNVYLRAIGMELKLREQQELEARIEELEELVAQNNRGRGYGR
jgi:hypothetical protein